MKNLYSQCGQDAWVLGLFPDGIGRYYVEVGAHDGCHASNTWGLEQRGWLGLCIEPGHPFTALKRNRTCATSDACVWNVDGDEVEFCDGRTPQLSGIKTRFDDFHKREFKGYRTLKTKTLRTLFAEHQVPGRIDYLSVDTEGSELEVLQGIDWENRQIGAITVEHNLVDHKQQAIREFLRGHGFVVAVWARCDDWFVREHRLAGKQWIE